MMNLTTTERVERVADVAEVIGGYRVTESGSVVALENADRLELIRHLGGAGANLLTPIDTLLRPFVELQ